MLTCFRRCGQEIDLRRGAHHRSYSLFNKNIEKISKQMAGESLDEDARIPAGRESMSTAH